MPRLLFDSTTCGRCGGTGRMPYAAYNGVCLRCNGSGTVLTRSGKAASARWSALRATRCAIPLAEVAVGMRLRHELWTPAGGSVRYTATVLAVGPDSLNEGFTLVTLSVPERWQPGFGKEARYLAKDGTMDRPVTEEDLRAFVAAHPRLKGYRLEEASTHAS